MCSFRGLAIPLFGQWGKEYEMFPVGQVVLPSCLPSWVTRQIYSVLVFCVLCVLHYEVKALISVRYIYCRVSVLLHQFDCDPRGFWNWLVIIDPAYSSFSFSFSMLCFPAFSVAVDALESLCQLDTADESRLISRLAMSR